MVFKEKTFFKLKLKLDPSYAKAFMFEIANCGLELPHFFSPTIKLLMFTPLHVLKVELHSLDISWGSLLLESTRNRIFDI